MPAQVVLQAGHVARRTGATGTTGEQAVNRSVCDLAAAKLRAYGHTTRVIGADEVYTAPADVFIAHHADGSDNITASGASVGYPDSNGGRLAYQVKVAYTGRGWPYGFRADNYTPGLRGYYAYSRHSHIRHRMVLEAGFMTNPGRDRPWIDGHHGSIAQALTDAVNALFGTPIMPPPPPAPAPAPAPAPDPQEDYVDVIVGIEQDQDGIKVPPGAPHFYVITGSTMSWIRTGVQRDDMVRIGWKDGGNGKGALWCRTFPPVDGPMRIALLAADTPPTATP